MIHLGSVGKTSIDVDGTFLLIIGLFVLNFYDPRVGIKYALLWIPVIFVSVLLHELAHAGTIALFGHGGSQIVLGGMGGLTMNERRGRPWQEVLISLAGPFSSFLLAWLTAFIAGRYPGVRGDPMVAALIPLMYTANIWWGIFNLAPISPLDGGQAVRNFLRIFLREKFAFVIAVWIGIVVGIALVVYGIRSQNYFIALLIGWYVWINFQQWQYFRSHGFPGD
jgi:stage IV sporulation protein FB